MRKTVLMVLCMLATAMLAATGTWQSMTTGGPITYTTSAAIGTAAKGNDGKPMTIVYLENLNIPKNGQNSNAEDVTWLRRQGYQVIELDYGKDSHAVSPLLNSDIIAINSSLQSGKFCGCDCSPYRSYILMEGYRISRDIPYYHDDPSIYNYPDGYKNSEGDWLYLDLVYPANPSTAVPVLVTFSYSNSFATYSGGKLTDANKHKRMYLPYFWGAFKDSFVEGVSALGFAWAVCDHPKYCDWGQGKYKGGANKSLGSIQVNPDAARKVKSAIRTIRGVGRELGLNGNVAVTGFSRGATAASLAVGDGSFQEYEDDTRGLYTDESSLVQCAILGPGMFDYEHALQSSTEYQNMRNYVNSIGTDFWPMQGALATIQTQVSAPTLFYYNMDDYYKDGHPQGRYCEQAALMKARLDEVGTPTETLIGYSSGHAVPQETNLEYMYDFLLRHVPAPVVSGIEDCATAKKKFSATATYNLMGIKVGPNYKGLVIQSGQKKWNR